MRSRFLKTFLIGLALAMGAPIAQLVLATSPEDLVVEVIVVFDSAELSEPPMMSPDGILIIDGEDETTLDGVPPVSDLVQMIPKGSTGYSNAGPWFIRFITLESEEDLLQDLLDFPQILRAQLAEEGPPITLGEAAKSWFPPEVDENGNCAFCTAQHWLHSKNLNEEPGPTLFAAGLDECDWASPVNTMDADLPQAWGITRGDSTVVVAVIDTGVSWEHPELGGSGPERYSPDDELLSGFRQGTIYHNYREEIGDADENGYPGQLGDDDDDGLSDEDYNDIEAPNVAEDDVITGAWTAVDTFTVTDATAGWEPDSLAGHFVRLNLDVFGSYHPIRIDANSDSVLHLDSQFIETLVSFGIPGALHFTEPDAEYAVSNLIDDDGDRYVDDWWTGANPAAIPDDDENGYPDDLKGWSFLGGFNDLIPFRSAPGAPGSSDSRPIESAAANNSHGTWIAGIIAARDDGVGLVGVAPGVKVLPINASAGPTHAQLAQAIHYARDLRDANNEPVVDIITFSYGASDSNPVEDFPEWDCSILEDTDGEGQLIDPLARALKLAVDDGIVIVAAAGNTGTEEVPYFFHCNENVISVGGVRPNNRPALDLGSQPETTWGEWIDVTAVSTQLSAPQDCLLADEASCNSGFGLSAVDDFGWVHFRGGTSLASPQVAGIAALMLSVYPDMTPAEVQEKIKASVDPIDYTNYGPNDSPNPDLTGKLGTGRVNAYKALTYYGDTTNFGDPLVWSDEVWVSGDILVSAGATLEIEPGTIVHMAQDDIHNNFTSPYSDGLDSNIVEIRVEGTLTASGSVTFELFDDGVGPPGNPNLWWGPIRTTDVENLEFEGATFNDLVPNDVASGLTSPKTTFKPGDVIALSWTTTNSTFEDSVRVRASIDGGATFDAGTIYDLSAGTVYWAVGSEHVDGDLVLRVEFLDEGGYIIAHNDFDEYHVAIPFENVSAGSGISVPENSEPYASAPLDYNADGKEDLVVSYADDFVQLYQNTGSLGGDMEFVDQTVFDLGDVTSTKGVNRIDFANDGAVDLFFASGDGSLLFQGDPQNPGDLTTDLSDSLLSAASDSSSAAAWGDFNRDGFLDVYIIQEDASDVLLQATVDAQGKFSGYTDVTVTAGLYTDTPSTSAAMWADFDGDGFQDLFVAWDGAVGSTGQDPDRCFYYLNDGPDGQGDYTFTEDGAELAGSVIGGFGNVSGVDFADLNGDSELDLLLARKLPGASDGLPNLIALLYDGTGDYYSLADTTFGIITETEMNDVEVTDVDGNGVLDVIGIPADGSESVVYFGFGGDSSREYWDTTYPNNLGDGDSYGIAAADFNADTDPDLFLLRPEEGQTKAYLWENPRFDDVPTSGNERYLTVGFEIMPNGLNKLALGTKVTVCTTPPGGTEICSSQVVDGGSGHGSQGAGRLVFGLGGADTASIEVFWPNGRSQSFSDASALAGFPAVTLDYPMDPEIDEESVTVTYTPSQGSTTHKWTWWVEHAPGNPQVLLSLMEPTTTECKSILGGGTQLLLEQGVPGVSVQVIPMDGGFECRVYYNVYCNAPCNYSYSVRNDFSGVVYGAGGFTHTVSVCGGIGM